MLKVPLFKGDLGGSTNHAINHQTQKSPIDVVDVLIGDFV